jgi:AcrR family transcriptional regulator
VAWDTEGTRRALLDAAVAEFGERGFSGARVGGIAKRAGVYVVRLYAYFGNKAGIFEAVLTDQLVELLTSTAVQGAGSAAIGDFVVRFARAVDAAPTIARLAAWEGLEFPSPVDAALRANRAATKVAELQAAMPTLDETAARHLLLAIVTLAYGWQVLPNLRHIILAGDTRGTGDEARIRSIGVALAEAAAGWSLGESNP